VRRLTVIQLLPALHAGGVELATLNIAQGLTHAGHQAIVISAGGPLVQPLLDYGAKHIALDIGRKSLLTLRHIRILRRIFVESNADIIHAHSRLPAWLGWLAWRGLPQASRPRWVTSLHGLHSPNRYSAIMTSGERVICVSQTARNYFLQHYPRTDPKKLRVIACGVDTDQFPRIALGDLPARQTIMARYPMLAVDKPLLLLPGRGTRLKGHIHALRLLAALHAEGIAANLWMPGALQSGRQAYIQQLTQQAKQLGIAQSVLITENTRQIAQAYAASDLVLQLSDKPEAFGRTVLEALSVGRPVLGWDHGGVGEQLRNLQPEGAVPLGDHAALVQRARDLLQHPPIPVPSSAIPFTLQAMQQATLDVYAELANSDR